MAAFGDFGGASQFHGGGFMPSPQAGAGDLGYGNRQKARSDRPRQDSVRHVTISQLLKNMPQGGGGQDEQFLVDGQALANVVLVGRIVGVQENATKINYQIHDGTGLIEAHVHVTEDQPQSQRRELQPNNYVRVFGTPRTWNNMADITAYSLKPVTDVNEVSYHNLKVIFEHLHITRGPAPAQAMPMASALGGMMAPPYGQQPAAAQGGFGAPAAAGGFGGAAAAGAGVGGGAGQQQRQQGGRDVVQDVLSLYNDPANKMREHGVSIQEAEQQLRLRGMTYTSQQVRDAITALANDGHLYTTRDEETFKSSSE